MGAFRISFFLQFCGFDGQLLLELILGWNRVSSEQCIKFDFCLVNPQFFDSLFFKLGFGVTQEGKIRSKMINGRTDDVGAADLLNQQRHEDQQQQHLQ